MFCLPPDSVTKTKTILEIQLEVKTNQIANLEKALQILSKRLKANEIEYLEAKTNFEVMLNTLQKSHYKLSIDLHNKDIEIKNLNEKLNKKGSFFKISSLFN
jgi:predicted  nucleic acid-binding Zn-ribbon protein